MDITKIACHIILIDLKNNMKKNIFHFIFVILICFLIIALVLLAKKYLL